MILEACSGGFRVPRGIFRASCSPLRYFASAAHPYLIPIPPGSHPWTCNQVTSYPVTCGPVGALTFRSDSSVQLRQNTLGDGKGPKTYL